MARDGITIVNRGIGRWLYRVYDQSGARRNKTFKRDERDDNRRKSGCAAGDLWAEQQRASFTLGVSTAARSDLAVLAQAYVEHRRSMGCSEGYLRQIERAAALAMEAGVRDLADPKAPTRITAALAGHRACRPGQINPTAATARTKNSYIAALRSLGNFAVKRRLVTFNPFLALDRWPEARKSKPTYSINELRSMLEDHRRSDPWWLFVALAVYTGQRSETLRQLTWGMLDWEANRIRIPAEIMKANNDTRVPIQPELRDILRSLPQGIGKAHILPPEIARVTSDRANELTQAFLQRCGIHPNGRSVHAFRHTCAGLLTATGLGVFAVMDALGHANMATSKHYSALADLYRERIKHEGWTEGKFFLRRTPLRANSESHSG